MAEVSNEKALKIVEQQYIAFINANEKWDFFRGLAEYAKTLQELAPTKPLIEALEKQREVSRALYERMNSDAFKELTKSAEQITKVAQQVAEKYEPVFRASKELHDHLNLTILSSDRLYALNSSIFDVARRLKESGLAEAIKKFEDNQRAIKNIYGNYTFSPTYEKLAAEEKKLERQEQVETWGAWQQLPLVKRLVFEPEKIIDEVKKEAEADRSQQWTLLNLFGVAGEMEKIRSGEASDNDVVYFRVKDFKGFAQRVHSYVTAQLLQTDTDKPLEFDPKSSTLIFQGIEILIAKSKNKYPHDLLQTLFKEPAKLWNYDEVAADWHDYEYKKENWKKFYNAAYKVNQKIAEKTTIKDFLMPTKKTININKKYLSS